MGRAVGGACRAGDGCVSFSLDAKAGDGGAPIRAYRVTYVPTDPGKAASLLGEATVELRADDDKKPPATAATPSAVAAADHPNPPGSSSSSSSSSSSRGEDAVETVTCSGLVNGVEYRFWLQAVNEAGAGPKTSDADASSVALCTPAAPPPRPAIARVVPMDMALQVTIAPAPAAAADRGGSSSASSSPSEDREGEEKGAAMAIPPTTHYVIKFRVLNRYAYGPMQTKEFTADTIRSFILRDLVNGVK